MKAVSGRTWYPSPGSDSASLTLPCQWPDDQLYKVLKPFSLPAEDTSGLGDDGARIDWLVPFTLQDSTGSGSRASSSRPAPVEDSYFPPVINHSTRLVCGIPGGGRCMLAGRGRGERAFLIRSGGTLYLEGFQLSEWATTTGGAIRVDSGGRAILVNCILNNNKAEANGASLGGEAPDVSDAWGLNGALWSLRSAGGAVLVAGGGSFEATDVVFERNEAKDTDPDGTFGSGGFGGAIAVLGMGSKMRCTRCSFISNTAGSAGGAVALAEGGIAAMQGGGGTFNQAELAGGLVALLGQGSRLEVSEFNMEENFARSGPGGCVAAHGGGHVLIKSSRLMKNEASGSYGGAIALDASSQGFLDSSNLQRNTAAGNGGGLSIAGASRALLVNTTVAACDALEGGAIDVAGEGSELELGLGCLLNENTAGAHGGHLSVRDGGLATSQGTRFRRGTSEGVGGGGIVVVGRASAFVGEELRFQDNKAMNGGIGGGMLISGGMVAIRGGKILGNSASIGGAGHVEAGGKLVLSGRLQLLENVVGPGTHGTELSLDDSSHLVADGLEIQPSGGLTGATILVSGPSRAVLWHVTFIRPSTSRRLLQQTRVDILVDNEQKAMVAVREAVGSPVPHIQSLSGDSMDEVLGACLPLTCMGSAPSADGACQLPPDRFVNDMPSEALLPDFGCKSSLQRSIATSLPVISANNAPNCMMEDPAPGELCGEGGLVMLKSTKCLEGDYCDPNLEVPPPSPPPPPPPPPATPMVTEDPNIFLLPESAEPPTVSPAPTPVRESNAGIPTFKPGPEVDPIIGNPIQISYPGAVVSTDPTADGAKLPTQGPGLDQVKEDGSEIIEPAPRPPQPRQEPGISTRFIVLIAAGILFVLLVGGATSVIVWRAGVARNKSQQRDEGAWPRDSRAMGLSQPALDFTQSSPYSTNTSGTGTPQKDSDKSLPKAKAFKWRTCYAFLPCGSIDMLYGDSDHGEHGPRLDAVQVKGQPGVFRPPKPHGQLIQHPELPHFAPKDWGRSSIYLTLPARLDDLDGQRELSAGLSAVRSSLASDDANTKGTGLRRRLSCPDSFSSLVMLPSTLEVPSMPPSHRTIKLHHTIVAATKAAMMPMAEAKPHVPFDGTAIVRGLSHSEWAQAGLVEIDFNTEIKPYLKNQIGSGAFGDVFLATWRGCDVAVKIFNRGFAGATGEQARPPLQIKDTRLLLGV